MAMDEVSPLAIEGFQKRMGRTCADIDAKSVSSVSAYTTGSIVQGGPSRSSRISAPLSARGPSVGSGRPDTGQSRQAIGTRCGSFTARGNGSASIGDAAYEVQPTGDRGGTLEWAVLDKLADQLHRQDASTQKQKELELQQRLRNDLDKQIADTKLKKNREREEDRKFHESQVDAIQKWHEQESAKEKARKDRLRVVARERDVQLELNRKRRDEEKQRLQQEAQKMQDDIERGMDSDRRLAEKKLHQRRQQIQKALEMSSESAKMREDMLRQQRQQEEQSVEEYQLKKEQRQQQVQESKDKDISRRNVLESVAQERAAVEKRLEDEAVAKAKAQRAAKDKAAIEKERANQDRLTKQRLDTQAYLLSQMKEKQSIKAAEKERKREVRQTLETSTRDLEAEELRRVEDKKVQHLRHKVELEKQIAERAAIGPPKDVLSDAELKINKKLLQSLGQASGVLAPPSESS